MSWIIYKHTNKLNGKVYIGQTHQDPKERWRRGDGYKHNKYFYNAIKKRDWNKGFLHEIIEKGINNQAIANEREIFYIQKYKSYVGFADCNGYNLTKGGDNHEHLGLYVLQIKLKTLEIVASFPTIRAAEKSTKIDHSQIGKCCMKKQTTAGGFYWCYQKDWNNDWSPRLNQKCGNRYTVYQIDKNTLKIINKYNSTVEAGLSIGKAPSNISLCCNKKGYSTVAGFYWCYKKDYSIWHPRVNKNELKLRMVIRMSINNINDKKEYRSITSASKENNVTPEAIAHCCDGKTCSSGGFYWCYKENIENWKPRGDKVKRKVICIETNTIYNSITEASNKLKISKTYLGRACKDTGLKCGGYHWQYMDEYNRTFIPREKKSSSKSVICIETNKIYKSGNDASKDVNGDVSTIFKCCKDYSHTCKGYHWAYFDDFNKGKFAVKSKKIGRHGMKKIFCHELHKTFSCINEASKELNIDVSSIIRACKGKQKVAGGYHWKYCD